MLSGPAGFGKTTLLSQWLAAPPTPRPAAWVTLDGRDDAAGFVAHLVAALRPAGPGRGRATLGLLRLPGTGRPADLGASLAEELLAPAPADGAVLVLDDLQEVADPGVYESWTPCCATRHRACAWWRRRGSTRPCPWPGGGRGVTWWSCARPTCASPSPRRGLSSAARSPPLRRRPTWRC